MSKYKDYLDKAKEIYSDCTFEELVEELKDYKDYLSSLEQVIPFENSLFISKDGDKRIMKVLYSSNDDEDFVQLVNLLIKICKNEINMIKAMLYDMIEKGNLEDE